MQMMARRLSYNLLLAWIFLVFSVNAFAVSSEKEDVQKAYQSWCAAIGTAKGNPQEVVKYYAPNAILLPTLSHKMLKNTDGGLDAYFKKLTSNPEIKCVTHELVTHLHGDVATNSGFYSFIFMKDGKEVDLPARFTFVYKKEGGEWLIIKHHSSELPKVNH